MNDWRAMLASGELQRIAAGCHTRGAMAQSMGIGESTLKKQLHRLGTSFQSLRYGERRATGAYRDVDTDIEMSIPDDFDDEEPTRQDLPIGTFDGFGEPIVPIGNVIPAGHFESGRSTLVRGDPNSSTVLTWHKTSVSREQYRKALLDAVLELAAPMRGTYEPVEQLAQSSADLLAVYCLGDPHLGLLAWHRESGQDHDLEIGKRDLIAAVDHLVSEAPAADTALICSLGDLVHFDNEAGTTTAGTKQDADTRWFKVMLETVTTMRRCIDRALEKHRHVIGWMIRGNHDRHASAGIAIALAQAYENEPRVRIDLTPDPYSWLRFGKVLIGANHSDENSKPESLAAVMACDRAEDWGLTLYRYMLCGHLHHTFAKEANGVLVERFPTLAPKDAWHHGKGYRAQQSMCVDVYHREWGRQARRTIGVRQLRAA